MAGRDARQHRAGLQLFAQHRLTRHRDSQGTRGRHAKRCHGFADDGFPQHRPKHGAAITTARERRAPTAFQMDIAALSITINHLTQ